MWPNSFHHKISFAYNDIANKKMTEPTIFKESLDMMVTFVQFLF